MHQLPVQQICACHGRRSYCVEDAIAIEEDVGECKLARGDAGKCFSPLSSNSVRAKAVGVPAVENALAEEDVAECSLARGDAGGRVSPLPSKSLREVEEEARAVGGEYESPGTPHTCLKTAASRDLSCRPTPIPESCFPGWFGIIRIDHDGGAVTGKLLYRSLVHQAVCIVARLTAQVFVDGLR